MPVLADDPPIARLPDDVDDGGVGRGAGDVRMQEQSADPRGEHLLSCDVEVLVAKEDHAMRGQRAADRRDGRLIEILREVGRAPRRRARR